MASIVKLTIRIPNIVLRQQTAVLSNISSICKYSLFNFITDNNIYLHIRNLQYTIYSQIAADMPAISGLFHVVHDTSDIDTCLYVNNVSRLDSPCQNVYIKLKKKKLHLATATVDEETSVLHNIFRSSITTTPHVIQSLQPFAK